MRCLYRYHLSANPTKWSNTLKQFVAKLPTSCLSVFDHFAELALKGLRFCYFRSSLYLFFPAFPWVSFVMEDCFCLDNHLLHLLIKHNHCYLWVNNSFLKACVFIHYVKSVQIRSFFWVRIQPEYGKIRTWKNSVFGHFLHSDFCRVGSLLEKIFISVFITKTWLRIYILEVAEISVLFLKSDSFMTYKLIAY